MLLIFKFDNYITKDKIKNGLFNGFEPHKQEKVEHWVLISLQNLYK